MSIFHIHEWFGIDITDATVFAVGKLANNRDELVIGYQSGHLLVLDPSRGTNSAILLEDQLPNAIIDIAISNFVNNADENVIALLSPYCLMVYRLISDGSDDGYRLSLLHQHPITSPAHSMCHGNFGRASWSQLCVQSLCGTLTVLDAEHVLFTRQLSNVLQPGPVIYAPQSDSLLTTSDSILSSFKYATLATSTSTGHGKKIIADWTFHLGDWPLCIDVIDKLPVQPSIVVLCKRTLLCFTHGGALRYSIRLQSTATALLVYNTTSDAYVQLCIATTTRTLLFYMDTVLSWTSQVNYQPIQLGICSVSCACPAMLAVLGRNRFSISYLGTEPSLFRLPASQTRFIDFAKRLKEFQAYEALINQHSVQTENASESRKNPMSLRHSIESFAGDRQSGIAADRDGQRLQTKIQIIGDHLTNVRLSCHSLFEISPKYAVIEDVAQPVLFDVCVKSWPITDLRCHFYAFSPQNSAVAELTVKLPLNSMCQAVNAQRKTKQFKITLESSENIISISELFSGRYRIQADTINFLYLYTDEVVARVRSKQPNVKFTTSVPLEAALREFQNFYELESKKLRAENELSKFVRLYRAVQTTILTKQRSERPTSMDHMKVLVDYTQNEMNERMDNLERAQFALCSARSSLGASLNLLSLVASIQEKHLPFDSAMLNNSNPSEQPVWERLKWIVMQSTTGDSGAELNITDLRNFLTGSVAENQRATMEDIDEETEQELNEHEAIHTVVSGSLPFNRYEQ